MSLDLSQIDGGAIINALHSGPDRNQTITQQPQSLSVNPALNLQQIRFAITEKENRVLDLQADIQQVPAAKMETFQESICRQQLESFGGGRYLGGRGRYVTRCFPVTKTRETTASQQLRAKINSANASINKQLSALNGEINALKAREQQLIQEQAIKQQQEAKLLQEQQVAKQREQDFISQLANNIVSKLQIPQSQQTIVLQQFKQPEQQDKPIQKKPSSLPLIAGLGLIGVGLLG